ncbi:MAG: sugar phosphate nucleotidyltransferase [Patescibacteria group bacterium]|nr:sugar phosphate nucleotidyltransferase [Patescibacteria group bacterium]
MKILIFGRGFLGTRMAEAWSDAVLSDARIDDAEAVKNALDEHRPDVVVNAAGKTGKPNIDWCEAHQTETFRGNTIGPLVLAETCQTLGIHLVHLGTSYIFNGPSPDPVGWRENDFANPVSFYARSKYSADMVLSRLPRTAIVRIGPLIDPLPSPRNLITRLVSYAQVADAACSVTVVADLLEVVHALAERRATGTFHAVNPGALRFKDLLDAYKEIVDPRHPFEMVQPEDLLNDGSVTKARPNPILHSKRLEELGIRMRPVNSVLREVLEKYAREKSLSSKFGTENMNQHNTLPPKLRRMKGVILAGGKGTRLAPLTNITNKHLLPIYNQPMVMYPLQTLLDAGIKDILLITGPDHAHQFIKLFGSGKALGCHFSYRIQDEAGGIAQALGLAEDFVGQDNCTVILGDNVFDEPVASSLASFSSGALAFYKPVENPTEYGVMEIDEMGNVLSIEEKPKQPKSNLAQVGLYVYDPHVFDIIKTLKPSGRGELEITDVNNHYLAQRELKARRMGGIWWDMGTFHGMQAASQHFAQKDKK